MKGEKHDLADAMERECSCMGSDGEKKVGLRGENLLQGWGGLWRWLVLMLYLLLRMLRCGRLLGGRAVGRVALVE